MRGRSLPERSKTAVRAVEAHGHRGVQRCAVAIALSALLAGCTAAAQVITVDTSGNGPVANSPNAPVSRRYMQIKPTDIKLSKKPLDPKTRLLLLRALQSEQGFAMRPFPRGHKGLTLEANGKLDPAGEKYVDMVTRFGLSANPGDRLVITNVKFEKSKIVLDLNGGPDRKHRFLSHIQIGVGPTMTQPVVPDGKQPTGARLTLAFHGPVPELTGNQVESLLAPLISFKVKTPVQAYTDTLPAALKKAILDHKVLVGMSTKMVRFAKGEPVNKFREQKGQMPFTVWMYGRPPHTVVFVHINGNRVIRVEIARVGKPLEVFTKDVVTPMMMAHGTPMTTASNVHVVQEGDVQRNPETQAPAPPPTLRAPGEKIPDATQTGQGQAGPVYFPPDTQDSGNDQSTQLGQNPDVQPPASAPAKANSTSTSTKPDSGQGQSIQLGKNPDIQPPAAAPANTKPAAKDGKQQTAPAKAQPTGQTPPPGS